MGQKIFVTGATSTIGSQIVKQLQADRVDFTAGLNKISAAIDRPINFIPISHQQAHDALIQYGASNYVANLIGSVEQASEEGAMEIIRDGVQNILGRPPISFDQFIMDHIAVWR